MKIWPTYAVLPVTMLYLRSIYDLWRAWSYPDHFATGWKDSRVHLDRSERARPILVLLQTDIRFFIIRVPSLTSCHFFPERETAGLDRLSGVKGASGSSKINWSPIYLSVNPPIKSYRRNFNFLWPWNCCNAQPATLIYDIFPEIWCIRNELCYNVHT